MCKSEPIGMLADDLKTRIKKSGPLSFSEFVESCLYDSNDGFYTKGGGAGRRGDFLTSPEVGPFFGFLIANWLDETWRDLNKPENFQVVEVGAGSGALARSIIDAKPKCLENGIYTMVERSQKLREAQPTSDKLISTAKIPEVPLVGAVIANELLDNLPFDLLEGDGEYWKEVRIGLVDDQFVETLIGQRKDPVGVSPLKGARIPIQTQAIKWVESILEMIVAGSLLVIDYGSTTQEMSQRDQDSWLRTFRKHSRGNNPLDDVGNQDLTVEVAIDQLPEGALISTQKDFLKNQGIDNLVEEGRQTWREFSSVGDLKAVKARSRVTEAEALLDPMGLGGFFVLEWHLPFSD